TRSVPRRLGAPAPDSAADHYSTNGQPRWFAASPRASAASGPATPPQGRTATERTHRAPAEPTPHDSRAPTRKGGDSRLSQCPGMTLDSLLAFVRVWPMTVTRRLGVAGAIACIGLAMWAAGSQAGSGSTRHQRFFFSPSRNIECEMDSGMDV